MPSASDPAPDDITALRGALAAEQLARREAEARASGAEAMVAHLKLLVAKLRHEQFGASSERGSKLLDQLELQLEELEATAAEDESVLNPDAAERASRRPIRCKPVREPLPAHLPRERVVIPGPTACPCCNGKLSKLGKDVTETLEVVPPGGGEGDPDGARAVQLPGLRDGQPGSGAVPPDRARTCRSRAAGHNPGSKIRPTPAVEPPERNLCCETACKSLQLPGVNSVR